MKKLYFYILIMLVPFFSSVLISVENFNDIKHQYKNIEPNLDNFSTAEVIFLAFERMKISLYEGKSKDDFLIRKEIFDSKLKTLKTKSMLSHSFYTGDDFLLTLNKLTKQSDDLSKLYVIWEKRSNSSVMTLNYLKSMQQTITDLQEVIYKIQIKNFNKTKDIIADNSSEAELYSLFCIALIFTLIVSLVVHATKLKKTLKEKNIFISAIYHELSGSIQKIQLSSELIDIEGDTSITEKYLNSISFHSNKLFHQTREILDYSKVEIGNSTLNKGYFNPEETLRDILLSFSVLNNNKLYTFPHGYYGSIFSDKQKIFSIIYNLLDNSNKNTTQGVILMHIKVINRNLYIRVKDTGSGFDIKKLSSLLKPFNQGIEHDTRQGLGLGLTIINNHINILGGKFKVRSSLGEGTTFFVRIPVQ